MTHFENCSIHAKTFQLCTEHISCHHDVFFQYFIFGVFVLFRCTVNNVAAVAVAASVVTFGIFLLLLLKMITLYTNYPRQNQTIHLFEDTWAQSPANDRTIFLSFFSFFSRAYKACRAASRNENVAGRKWIKTKHEKNIITTATAATTNIITNNNKRKKTERKKVMKHIGNEANNSVKQNKIVLPFTLCNAFLFLVPFFLAYSHYLVGVVFVWFSFPYLSFTDPFFRSLFTTS